MIDNYASLHERGPRTVAPTFIANALVDSCSGMIAIETGAIGHNMCVVSACATGTHNVGEAAEAIRRGDCIAVISGSTEAPLLEVGHAGFSNMRGMGMPRPGEGPETVSRPFDLTRDGFVLGEGAGSLFLEDLELAKARGATDLRRGRRLRLGRRRVGHDPADRRRGRLGAGDADGTRASGCPGRRGRSHQPARDLDAARRQARGRGDLDRLRVALGRVGAVAGDQRDQVDDRPHDGRGRGVRGVRHGDVGRRAVRAGDDQLPRRRSRVRPVGRARDDRPCRSATRCRTTSASADTTAR